MKLGGIYISVGAKTKKLAHDLAKAKGMTKKAAVLMNHEIGKVNFAHAALAAAALGAAMVGLTMKVVSVGREFESTMKTVQAWSGASGEALKDLTDKAREMGATTEHTATEAAGALKFLAAAGFSAEKSIAALPGTLDLATAGQVALAEATDITTDVLTAFGLNVKELGRVNDAFITTTSNSNTNVLMLGQSMKMVAPTAKLFGLSIEQTAAYLGTLANAGVKSEMAGSGLNMVLLKSQRAAKMLGMELDSSLIDVLKRMKKEQWGAVKTGEAFGARQVKTAAILMNNIGAYEKLTKKINENAGATQKLAGIIRDSLDNDIKILNSTIEEELLRTFDKYNDYMRDVIQSTTEWIRQNPQTIDQFAKLAKNMFELFATMSKIIKIGAGFANVWVDTFRAMGLASTGLISWKTALTDGVDAVEKFGTELGIAQLKAKKLRDEIKEMQKYEGKSFYSSDATIPQKIAQLKSLEEQIKRITNAQKDASSADRFKEAHKKLYNDLKKINDMSDIVLNVEVKKNGDGDFDFVGGIEAYKKLKDFQHDTLTDMWRFKAEGQKAANEESERMMSDEYEAFKVYTDTKITYIKNGYEEMILAAQEFGQSIDSAFEGAMKGLVKGLADGSKSIKDVASDLLSNLADSFLDYAMEIAKAQLIASQGGSEGGSWVGAALKGIGGWLGGSGGGLGGSGGGLGGGMTTSPSFSPGGAAMGFADGGISTGPSSGHLELLHGTEAVIPLKNGSIPVETKGGGTGAGDSTTYNININAIDSKSLAETLKRNPEAIIAPIADQANKGNTGLQSAIQKAQR